MSIQKQVCLNIRQLRNKKNISQEAVARELNIERSTYSRIELGKTDITLEMIEKISKVLDTDVPKLMGFNGNNIYNVSENNCGNLSAQGINTSLSINIPVEMFDEFRNFLNKNK
ncbi:MAG: helix-turn-helix transcriptional regulator [Flavobacteriales bacterium]|nr:helix-turn-helix transcriptional regulator [Flavobacteriales bacterium]